MTTPATDADLPAVPDDPSAPTGLTYREAGVDIAAAGALVGRIAALTRLTARPGAAVDLGGFGAVFDPRAAGYADPLLVASTDGVGTKLKIAQELDRHDTIGIDLVAMVANDLVVQGAEPLAFLDYIATGTLAPDVLARVVEGISAGCQTAGCALIGGETAEMPGMYGPGVYDLAGFAVGAVERGALLPRPDVEPGDVVLGLPASGLHANGFSLVRRLVSRDGIDLAAPAPFDPDRPLGEVLLTPTRIYVKPCLAAARSGAVKAMAHITGGGLIENIPRVLPAGLGVRLDGAAWPLPPVMRWLAGAGPVALTELARTFNCGIGMVVLSGAEQAGAVAESLAAAEAPALPIGRVVAVADGAPRVTIDAMAAWAG